MFVCKFESILFSNSFKCYKTSSKLVKSILNPGKRSYLSEAYKCKEAWNQRLQNHLISKINMDDFFVELSKKFTAKKKVSSVDIDLFACSITNAEHFEELENLLHNLRRSRQTVYTLESTHHAVVDLFLTHGRNKMNSLVKILNDRNNYGIFPTNYSLNILMDEFLKEKNYRDATKMAILIMLQENFHNEISKILSLQSCYAYMKEPQPEPWDVVLENDQTEEKPTEDVDEDEDIYVRVPFLRNPYFDDHFDIVEPQHLIGKTLYLAGKGLPDALGRSSQLYGLGLYQKWEKSSDLLTQFNQLNDQPVLFEESIVKFTNLLSNATVEDEMKAKLKNQIEKLQSRGLTSQETIESTLGGKLKDLEKYEKEDIAAQKKMFVEWETAREKALTREMELLKRKERIAFVKDKKKELLEKEQLLFFFENWKKHEMELAEIEEEERNRPISHEIEEYVPPEIVKKRSG